MPDRAGWLELAASGTDVAALAAAAWYLFARSIERDRRAANRMLAEFSDLKHSFQRDNGDADRRLPEAYPSPAGSDTREPRLNLMLGADPLEDRGDEATEAEDLLVARTLRSGPPYLDASSDAVFGWLERIWRATRSFGWFRVPLLAPIGLVLFVLFAAICVIRLPAVAIGYLLDSRNDFRLRIVVLAFAFGLALQVLRATTGLVNQHARGEFPLCISARPLRRP
jgi:hypothetical protein